MLRTKPTICTLGTLTFDGETLYTLEPAVPMPAGCYPVILTVSGRAARGELWSPTPDHRLPEILRVPGHTAARIHAGNTVEDTTLCVLVGQIQGRDAIEGSHKALTLVVARLDAAERAGEASTITIEAAA